MANENQNKLGERIAKVIARAGLASRREAEAWIEAGRVAVNGETINSPARDVTARDQITVDGATLPARERTRLFLYHKPRGLMTTHADPQGRPTIFQNLPADLPRLISIGRLDFNTEGLLLLTNDGELARILELPSTGWLRRYRVRAHGAVTQAELDGLRKGVTLSGIHYGAIDAAIDRLQGSNLWLTFAIREGKNREVRNVLNHLGLTVTRLIRVSFGPFQLGELAEGAVEEVRTRILREQLGEKLIASSDIDFSAPVAPRAAQPSRPRAAAPQHEGMPKKKNRQTADHAWRAHEQDRTTKKLRRQFHGSRRDGDKRELPAGEARAALVKDRKGRRIAVERYGQAPDRTRQEMRPEPRRESRKDSRPDARQKTRHEPRHEERPKRFSDGKGRRRSPDRATGPRPRHPRGR